MKDHTNTPIPEGFVISYGRAKVAQGAYKPKGNALVGSSSPRSAYLSPRSEYTRGMAAKAARK